jgi:RHS repeat-associated protein
LTYPINGGFCEIQQKTSYSRTGIVGAIANVLGNNFVGTATQLDVLSTAITEFSEGTSALFSLSGGSGTDTGAPYAYANALVYDKGFNVNTAKTKFARVTSNAGFDPGYETISQHEKLTIPTIIIEEPGYIYIYLSNESEDTQVWFDDLKITHTRSTVVAGADYYPFGFVMENREITREDYRYGYQGQFSEEEKEIGWNSFELRMYDSRIARWVSPDPYGQYASGYKAMGNAPISTIDPNGGIGLPIPPEMMLKMGAVIDNATFLANAGTVLLDMSSGGYLGESGLVRDYSRPLTTAMEKRLGLYQLPKPESLGSMIPNGAPTIGPYKPNVFARLDASAVPGTSLAYQSVNGVYVGARTFFLQPFLGNDIYNLDGTAATQKDKVMGIASMATAALPIKGVQANRAAGNAFRDELGAALEAAGRTVKYEVPKKTI